MTDPPMREAEGGSNGSAAGAGPGSSGPASYATTSVAIAPLTLNPRRRWWRIRPQALLGCVALAFVLACAGVLAVGWQHLCALVYYEAAGGNVDWHINRNNWRDGGVTDLELSPQHHFVTDSTLENLKYLNRLQALGLSECSRITDAGLAQLAGLKHLRILDLGRGIIVEDYTYRASEGRPLTDACLPHLAKLVNLRELCLAGSMVTDDGLAQLAGLTELESIDLSETQVTDAGLARLLVFPNLESVALRKTVVTDAGLEILKKLPKLKTLDVDDSQVTHSALVKLMLARPELRVSPMPDESGPAGAK